MSVQENVKDELADNAEHAKETVKDHVVSAAETVQSDLKSKAEVEMQRSAGDVSAVADAVRVAGDDLAARDRHAAARLANGAASSLDAVARELDGKSVEDVADAVASFGRRNPLALIGGAAVAGFFLGRFVTATTPGEDDYADESDVAPAAPVATASGPRPVAPMTAGVSNGVS
ncbi:hypothetical protein [Pontivivens insulae]|uniref:DUF883 domain-containing protein n=1 Tax=Pontivivens insulae TaxID=1639689 RepID=A0A2R8AA76_9RHOB|nr:hypothetical protein [Pontivivens insulae]RED12867.1 hypothetical protein DFR53_1998 [Pontivivens insulae]SPF28958.1 hypothetical protein POI8812_01261 [Pontivivens insulae]